MAPAWHSVAVRDLQSEAALRKACGEGGRGQSEQLALLQTQGGERDWKEAQELLGPAVKPACEAPVLIGRLEALSASLPAGQADFATRIATLEGSSEEVEEALAGLDGEMIDTAAAALSAERRARISSRVVERIANVGARLEGTEVESLRRRLEREEVRSELGLPFLSLFSLHAQVP